MLESQAEKVPRRSEPRQFLALVVITSATALALGVLFRQPAMMAANDISRWCTVWSLLERGTYVIDECPWLADTQDKVERPRGGEPLDAPKHFYSSKPALLATLVAGVLYPARALSGVPLDRVVLQEREERWVQKPDEANPGKLKGVLDRPSVPAKWPAYVFYFDAALVLLNIVPFGIFLALYARVLDRYAGNDWAWLFSLIAAAFGTYLLPFNQTLNNHTVAAFSAFFALYLFLRIWEDEQCSSWRFAGVGLFSAFTAVNEIPALAFAVLVTLFLLWRFPAKTLCYLIPAAMVPFAASLAAQYAALGELKLVYTEFGTESYLWEGSLWKTPLELDALNLPWFDANEAARRGLAAEPYALYLFHMTLGHHGFWSLTPIFFFSLVGLGSLIGRGRQRMSAAAWMTGVLTVILLAFYTWNPKARNYGGSTQGLRWLFWLIPFWLIMLPRGVDSGQDRRWVRYLALLALGVSVASVGYAMRNPWSHPWILDALEHLDLYNLPR
jgi:hypothetical protein